MNKISYILSILFTFTIFSACQSDKHFQNELNDSNWVASHFLITMPTHSNSDSTHTIEANADNWGEVLKVSPSKLHFTSTGTYSEEHFNLNGDLTIAYEGTWEIMEDSLLLSVEKPRAFKQGHLIDIEINESNSELILTREFDFDRDKQADDKQVVKYTKQ